MLMAWPKISARNDLLVWTVYNFLKCHEFHVAAKLLWKPPLQNIQAQYPGSPAIFTPNIKTRIWVIFEWGQIWFSIVNDLNIVKIVHVFPVPKLSCDISATLNATFTKPSGRIPTKLQTRIWVFLKWDQISFSIFHDLNNVKIVHVFPLPKLGSYISATLNVIYRLGRSVIKIIFPGPEKRPGENIFSVRTSLQPINNIYDIRA
jgi:hypothetical protein